VLAALEGFPARELISGWLRAGVIERGRWTPTDEGTPQGGVISPLLLNIALHGMEGAAGVRYQFSASNAGYLKADSPVLVRYADDLVVLCHTKVEAELAKTSLAAWLAPRGLAFNEDKTKIVHLDEGFDFLGFHVQRHRGKLLITPSKAALVRIRDRIATELRSLRGAPALVVIQRLNPIIRGWSSCYRGAVASEPFASLDTHLWRHPYKWARRSHRNKSKRWVVARYFGSFHPGRPKPLGLWRPHERRLPGALQLDPDRPAPVGAWSGVPGRSRLGRLLGPAPSSSASAARRSPVAPSGPFGPNEVCARSAARCSSMTPEVTLTLRSSGSRAASPVR